MLLTKKSILGYVFIAAILSGCQIAGKNQPPLVTQSVKLSSEPSTLSIDADSLISLQGDTLNVTNLKVDAANKKPADLWQVTRNNMQLELYQDNPRVQAQLEWFKKHPQYLKRVTQRASPYYYYIVEQALKRDIPTELTLLPIIESAFNPFAHSTWRAAGPWQFIPSTGNQFGLQQNWWYDGRRDIVRSTDAAFDFLQQLNKRFNGDWLLTLAAYNAGGGTVSKAISRNRKKGEPIDFWSLKLPKETMLYVPKLLAISALVKQPEQHNMAKALEPIENAPHFAEVDTGGQIDLTKAAAMADTSVKVIYTLNPGFNRWATSPDGPHRLLVPVDKAEQFKAALLKLPISERIKWTAYKVRTGDVLGKIAQRYETSTALIRKTNKIRGNLIRVGQVLMVPTARKPASEYVLSQVQRSIKRQQTMTRMANLSPHSHKIRAGESLWLIARKYNTSVKQLAHWNGIGVNSTLRVGSSLKIWQPNQAQQTSATIRGATRKIGYKVKSGDSLSRIADKFDVRIADILRWNKLKKSNYLQPNQLLTLYVKKS